MRKFFWCLSELHSVLKRALLRDPTVILFERYPEELQGLRSNETISF